MAVFDKRDVYHDGVWCLADMGTADYKSKKKISQTTIPFGDMAKYAKYFTYYLVVVVALCVLKRLYYAWVDDEDIKHSKLNSTKPKWVQKIAALNRYVSYRSLPVRLCDFLGIPSSLGNVIIVSASLLYMLCYTFIPHFWYRECRGFGSPPLAVRAGLECMALIPFVLMLSGKSNVISWLTGVSYEKINVYHRWVSIALFLLMWVHVIPFYYQAVYEGGMERLSYFQRTEPLFRNGIAPTVFLTWLCVASHTSLRELWYELFFHLHWLCGIGFCVSLYIHIYPQLASQDYLYATVGFWGSQILWRIFTKTALRPGKGFLQTRKSKATKFLITDGKIPKKVDETFAIEIDNSRQDFMWYPGQHLFLRAPGLRILDNHPFSICNVPDDHSKTIKLIIKPRKGLTRKIYDKIPDNVQGDMKFFIDGPYGGTVRVMESFTNIFLIASGSGISAVIPFVVRGAKSINNGYSRIQKIRLDWIVMHSEDLRWIEDELNEIPEELMKSGVININIYSCYDDFSSYDDSSYNSVSNFQEIGINGEGFDKERKTTFDILNNFPLVRVNNFKPNISNIIKSFKDGSLGNKNMFISSGSDSLKTNVSNSVASLQSNIWAKNSNVKEIYLHTESFGW